MPPCRWPGAWSRCAAIVGRKFADVADHAQYVREGGCAHIIAALAALDLPGTSGAQGANL